MAWGKALGTCRQLVGVLRADAPAAGPSPTSGPAFEPAPSPNALPPPPPPPIGSTPPEPEPVPQPPDVRMESEICPDIEAAIAEIPHVMAAEKVADVVAIRDRFADLPSTIGGVAESSELGRVAAIEFQKGLELVNQLTLTPPEQLANIAETLEAAAALATTLPEETPELGPAPSPNPLPPPPPPPLQ
jgi:hypothetical protein